jgi:valyl-tRNA synthetase
VTGSRSAAPAAGPARQAPTDFPAQYAPAEVEPRRYARWLQAGLFTADAQRGDPAFSIVIPPPNVTGSLHMGHALDHTLQDALVRRRRMQGYTTLWLPGMDHAGIATQNVVERELAKESLSRHDLGRERFVERVWQWKSASGGKILGQMRRLGDSVDWTRERFTMDEGLSAAVHTIFKNLFDDGLIYRAERIINWCPRCLTALSDIEVEHSEDEGELVSIRYGDGDDAIVVATTRAETMLGDTAVAVHPADPRYARLVGREIELPLTGRRVPVVADPHVDPDFGTGAVKVTPAHDPDDFEIGRRHGLASLTILDERGVVTVPGPFIGLDRFEARPAVVAALRAQGRIVAERRPYLHAVGHCQRCGTTVEPRLSLQWFVKVGPLARAAGDAVRDGRVRIHPPELAARYFDWVDDMHDWCISRQLWWGHRIPVWYGPAGEVRCPGPGEDPPAGPGWQQDADVLDTWFSSALWPFSTLGWPADTPDLRTFYPTSVLVTGYDILFFWVARMMMFGLYAMRDRDPVAAVPFRVVALHGLVRDSRGKKMSKSAGNVVDPLDWIERFGADATRFTLARGANPGSDVAVSEEWVAGARNFCNKLWNAARFALLSGATAPAVGWAADGWPGAGLPGAGLPGGGLSVADRWIMSRLAGVTAEVDAAMEEYEFGRAAETLYHFAWHEFCDWYLELVKIPLAAATAAQANDDANGGASRHGADGAYGPGGAHPDGGEHRGAGLRGEADDAGNGAAHGGAGVPVADRAATTRRVLGHVLDHLLRLLHPIMPHITDELWTALTGGESIMVADWPGQRVGDPAGPAADPAADPAAEAVIAGLMRLVTEVRRFRSDQGLRPGQAVAAALDGIDATPLAAHEPHIRALLRLSAPSPGFTPTASLQVEGVTLRLDLAGTIDLAAERRRLEKDLAVARKEADLTGHKLAKPAFTEKAPPEVVAATRARNAAAVAEVTRIEAAIAAMPG